MGEPYAWDTFGSSTRQVESYILLVADNGSERTRRPYGRGTLSEVDPGVWLLRVYLDRDVVTGKPVQRSTRFRGTRAAAEKALRQFHADLASAPAPKQSASSRVLLAEVVEAHIVASRWAPGTRRSYESLFMRHIEEGLGRERH